LLERERISGGLGSNGEAQVRIGDGELTVVEAQARKIVRDVGVEVRGRRRGDAQASSVVPERGSWFAEVATSARAMSKGEGRLGGELGERRRVYAKWGSAISAPRSAKLE
jgi:hypothetical protein